MQGCAVDPSRATAFGLDPAERGPIDWWCIDVITYPERLLELVSRWLTSGPAHNLVCTLKFQGARDHEVAARFAAMPGAQLFHLHNKRQELTCMVLDAP